MSVIIMTSYSWNVCWQINFFSSSFSRLTGIFPIRCTGMFSNKLIRMHEEMEEGGFSLPLKQGFISDKCCQRGNYYVNTAHGGYKKIFQTRPSRTLEDKESG